MNLKPLGDRIIVKQDEAQETTAGGLYNKGQHLPMPVKEGDRVLYGKYGGTEVDVDGEAVLILRADDIYAVYTD